MSNGITSAELRDYMYQALLILLEKKSFNDITIKDITLKAGVSRMSYYRNFFSKEEIFVKHLKTYFKNMEKVLDSKTNLSLASFLKYYFINIAKEQKLYKTLEKNNLLSIIHEESLIQIAYLLDKYFTFENKTDYTTRFIASGVVGMTIIWMDNNLKDNIDDLVNAIVTTKI